MSDLLTNTDGDIAITNNDLTLVIAEDEVKQRLEQRLRTFRGEWFLDIEYGMPWITDVLVKNPNTGIVEAMIKTHILDTPGVLELLRFELTFENTTRELDLRFTVLSTTGEVEVEVTI